MTSINPSTKFVAILSISLFITTALIVNQLSKVAEQLYNNTQFIGSEISRINSSIKEVQAKEKNILSYSEVANYLGITEATLNRLINETDIPYLKVDNRYIFHKAPLDAWLIHKANKYHIQN